MAVAVEGSVEWIDRDLEARKHLWSGLVRLGPALRIRFIEWAAKKHSVLGTETKVTSHTGTIQEAYMDLMMLAATHGLNLSKTCAEMERWLSSIGRRHA